MYFKISVGESLTDIFFFEIGFFVNSGGVKTPLLLTKGAFINYLLCLDLYFAYHYHLFLLSNRSYCHLYGLASLTISWSLLFLHH